MPCLNRSVRNTDLFVKYMIFYLTHLPSVASNSPNLLLKVLIAYTCHVSYRNFNFLKAAGGNRYESVRKTGYT